MNLYLRRFARQNDDKGISRTFVAVESQVSERDGAPIGGYYTLSTGSVAFDQVPERRLPHYAIPTVLLARLAVDLGAQGRGVGGMLLGNAVNRVRLISAEVGVFAIEVFALSEDARGFYRRRGFLSLLDDPLHLYLPLQEVPRNF